MAEISPFKGILYNTGKVTEPADVVTPPYDVISPREQERFYNSHPNNMIHLILGKPEKDDTPDNNPHTRAAENFRRWMEEDVLVRDDIPAFYLTSMDFEWDGTQYTRYGLIASVRIEPFEKGVILPHEKTFSRIKTERLNLLKACNTNFDPIFALFPDNSNVLSQLIGEAKSKKPDLDFKDHYGQHHCLWRITSPEIQKSVSAAIALESFFIADGHHRYETTLNYRNWLRDSGTKMDQDHPANFVMMYLSSMKDPGLIVLPAHRLLKEVDDEMMSNALKKGRDFFDFTSIPFNKTDREKRQSEFIFQLNAHKNQNAIGLLHRNQSVFHLLKLKPGAMDSLFSDTIEPALKELDVTVLTRLIFMELLGFDQKRLDNEKLIGYNSRENAAIDAVISGEYDAAFILNATKKDQVRSVALNRLTMPRKSTYFYPKVVSGLVQNTLTP